MGLKHLNMGYAFLDTETTHIDPTVGEVLEIAIVTRPGGARLHMKIQPVRLDQASPRALEINGFTAEKWAEALQAASVEPWITEALQGRAIIGHHPQFDMGFLKVFYDRLDKAEVFGTFDYRLIDTGTMAFEHLEPLGLQSLSLHNICAFLGISNEGEHGAMVDVERTMRVFDLLRRPGIFRRAWFRYRAVLWWFKSRRKKT